MTLDLHAAQIQGFFDIPTDNLFASPVMVRDIRDRFDLTKSMVVSPDVGGVVRARGLAKRINTPLAILDKRRERAGESEVMNVIGDVAGYTCILIDDIVDSGGTLVNAADALLANGAKDVYAYITHGVLSGGAVTRITSSRLKELVITDSIQPTEAVVKAANIRTLPIATLIAEAISRTAAEESVVEPVRLNARRAKREALAAPTARRPAKAGAHTAESSVDPCSRRRSPQRSPVVMGPGLRRDDGENDGLHDIWRRRPMTFQPPPTSAALRPPAPEPYSRRTSRPTPHRAGRCASRARHARRRRGAARPQDPSTRRMSCPPRRVPAAAW